MKNTVLINIYNNIFKFIESNRLIPINEKITNDTEFYNKINTDKYISITTVYNNLNEEEFDNIKDIINSKKNIDTIDVKITYLLLLHIDSEYNSKTPIFKSLINSFKCNNCNIIVISNNPLSTHVNKQIVELSTDTKKIFNYTYDRFKIDIRKHYLCSLHELVPKEEEKYLLNDVLKKKKNNLPKIKLSDPQAIWIGAHIGDIIKIHRDSEITGKSIYYRVVIND